MSLRVVTQMIADGWTVGRWPLGRPCLGRTVASVMKLHGGKTLAFVRTCPCIRADAIVSVRMGSVHPMDAKGFWKDYIKGPQTFHSHFLHRLGLEKLQSVWCTLWSGLQ